MPDELDHTALLAYLRPLLARATRRQDVYDVAARARRSGLPADHPFLVDEVEARALALAHVPA